MPSITVAVLSLATCFTGGVDADARAAVALAAATPAARPAPPATPAATPYDPSAPADRDGWRYCRVTGYWWRYKPAASPCPPACACGCNAGQGCSCNTKPTVVPTTAFKPALVVPGFVAPGGAASYTVPRPAFYPAPAHCGPGG